MVIPRMVSTGGKRCLVRISQEFISRRPIYYKPKSNIWYKAQWMGRGKIGKILQSIVEGTSVEESNKRVAGHMPRKTLVRKLDQLGYSGDEIAAVTVHSNIKSLDSYLDTMNERKSTELYLSGCEWYFEESSAGAKSKQQHKFQYSAARRLRG